MKQFHTKCGKTKELPRNGINLKKNPSTCGKKASCDDIKG